MGHRSGERKRKAGTKASSDEEGGEDTVDVTFDFFDLDPIDYHALKNLLSQLLSLRSPSQSAQTAAAPADIDVGELADVLLGPQKEWVGGTVKCDGESDPYAFVSVLDLSAYPDKPSVSALRSHFSDVLASPTAAPAQTAASMREQVTELAGQGRLGVLLSERLVNMPVQIMPHMLRQVGEEIAHAQSKGAPGFGFSHLLVPSRVFLASAEDEEMEDVEPPVDRQKKAKKLGAGAADGQPSSRELCLYHPEDEIVSRFALATVHFDVATARSTDGSPSVLQKGRLALVELSRWPAMVDALDGYLGASAGTLSAVPG